MTSVKNTSSASETSEGAQRTNLYIFAGQSNIRDGVVEYANIGQTGAHRGAEKRKRDDDYRLKQMGGIIETLAEYDITGYRDTDVHKILKKCGFIQNPRQNSNKEEFRFFLKIQELKDLVGSCVNKLKCGVSRPDSYAMRPEQAACCDKVVNYFRAGGDRFLIDAKMRFGKTHTTYRIARALGMDRVLILTYKPAVEDSWGDELERHVAFDGMKFRRVEEGDQGPGVYFSSMQGILADKELDACRRRRAWIYAADWDLVVFDEEHYGTRSKQAEGVKSDLSSPGRRWLFLSGTPYQARMSGDFTAEQTFTWRYEDEQRSKRSWDKARGTNPYAVLPDMSFHTYEFGSKVLDVAKLYSDDEQFHMAKMFAAHDDLFENPGMVGDFLDLLTGQSDRAKAASTSPWHSKRIDSTMLDHTLWLLPRVAACEAMKSMLLKHPKFREYEVINVAGNNETRLNAVRDAIKHNARTITLSCGRFTTGVTVPEWGAVFFMDDCQSPTAYYQTAFRCQSPWAKDGEIVKRECYVVDFNPHRLLQMVYTQQASVRDKETESIESRIRNYLDCTPIYLYDQVSLRKIDESQVMSVAIESRDLIGRFGMAQRIDLAPMGDDATMVSDLMGVDPLRAESIVKSVTDAGVAKGKVFETENGIRKKPTKEERKEVEQLRERVQTVLRRFPTYLHVTPKQEVSCRDVLMKGDAALFRRHVGVDLSTFGRMIELRVIDEDHLDNCIVHFNICEDRIMGDENGGRL